MTFNTILIQYYVFKINLKYNSFWLCSIHGMTDPQNSLPEGFNISAASLLINMLLPRTMTGFTMYIAVNILYFKIFNILMTFKTGLLSGIMNFRCMHYQSVKLPCNGHTDQMYQVPDKCRQTRKSEINIAKASASRGICGGI